MLGCRNQFLVISLIASNISFAGTMGATCSPGDVTVPCENRHWILGGHALFLQPTTPLNHECFGGTNSSLTMPNGVDPKWGWGFQLESGLHFTTANDINLNWYHFRQSNALSHPGGMSFTNITDLGLESTPLYSSYTSGPTYFTVNPAWDQVNIEFGKLIDLAFIDQVRWHGGFNYSRIDVPYISELNYTAKIKGSNDAYNYYKYTDQNVNYNGFGLRTGVDLTHCISHGFSIYANGAVSLLAGTSRMTSSYAYTNNDTAPTGANNQLFTNYMYLRRYNIVPELDGKIGFNYTKTCNYGDLIADIGWLWLNYFSTGPSVKQQTNFGMQGLYFGLKWSGNLT